jgi:hypothetical protein
MSTKSSINYKGFNFDFEYNFSPAYLGTYETPPEAEEFEIYNITLNGIDAYDLLDRQIEDFEEEVINNLKEY